METYTDNSSRIGINLLALQYHIERKGRALFVRIREPGSRRLLYLDTLKAAAQEADRPALDLLIKIHLKTTRSPETLSFDRIEVPPLLADEALRLMRRTGKVLGEIEEPPEKPLSVLPRLVLTDSSGCFANLWMNYEIGQIEPSDLAPTICGRPRLKEREALFEQDLLDAGYCKKIIGGSRYFCAKEQVREALVLLLGLGWDIRDPLKQVVRPEIDLRVEGGRIAIRGQIRGLIDHHLQMQGVWEGEVLYFKKTRVPALVSWLGSSQIRWDESLRVLAQGFQKGAHLERALPDSSFRGVLLPYQQEGVNWLWFLYQSGFSGLLADEMGLGKTVQVLAFLSRLGTNLPILIVAPTSLLFNWQAEINRFLPGKHEFVLISYTALRLNAEQYAALEFGAIVLDESNAIKTTSTQTARAACKLNGRFKICLSGTPMENRPDEIWAQFHFLLPDLVDRSAETLKEQIRPFILRRRKEDVQLDLPEKIEQTVWIEMESAQKELYESYRKGIRIEGSGTMQILEAILRLRQISCDPRLIGHEAAGAKIRQLMGDVEQAVEQGRKILIYSQFTAMLQLIRKELPEALYLDGATAAGERGELVRAFQQDPNHSIFLLSLKAGGVGLNLTAADYVLLMDPWWNEAAERQAIDRAHRIGQTKTVIVKRYLACGTIEEKMLQLKRKKQEASDQLLDFEDRHWTGEDFALLLSQ